MVEVNLNNRIDQIIQNSHNSIRTNYKDFIHVENSYNMWTDWKFYAFTACIMTSMYCLGVHLNYFLTPTGACTYIKESVYEVVDSIKSWFTGNRAPDDSESSSADSIYTTTRKQQLEEAKAVLIKHLIQMFQVLMFLLQHLQLL